MPSSNTLRALRTALQQIEYEKATLDRQIAVLRSVLGQPTGAPAQQSPRAAIMRRRKMSAAARKLISQRMKALWAKRRAAVQTKAKGK
jgi:hypothetical protein